MAKTLPARICVYKLYTPSYIHIYVYFADNVSSRKLVAGDNWLGELRCGSCILFCIDYQVTSTGPKNKTICQTNVPKVDASQWVTYGKQTNKQTNKQGKANRNRNSRKEQRVEGKQGVQLRILNAMTQGLTSASRRKLILSPQRLRTNWKTWRHIKCDQ